MILNRNRFTRQIVLIIICTSLFMGAVKPKKVEALLISSTAMYIALVAMGVLGISMVASDPDKSLAVGKEIVNDVKDIVLGTVALGASFSKWYIEKSAELNALEEKSTIPTGLLVGATIAIATDLTAENNYQFDGSTVEKIINNNHLISKYYKTAKQYSYMNYVYSDVLNPSTALYDVFFKTQITAATLLTAEEMSANNISSKQVGTMQMQTLQYSNTGSLRKVRFTNTRHATQRVPYDISILNNGSYVPLTISEQNLSKALSDYVVLNGFVYGVMHNIGLADGNYPAIYGSNNINIDLMVLNNSLFMPFTYHFAQETTGTGTAIYKPLSYQLYSTLPNYIPLPTYTPSMSTTQSLAPIITTTKPQTNANNAETLVNSTITTPLVLPNQSTINNHIQSGVINAGDDKTNINTGLILGSIIAGANAIDTPVISLPTVTDTTYDLPAFPSFGTEFPSLGDILTGAGISALFAWLGERIVSPLAWMGSLFTTSIQNIWDNAKNFLIAAFDTILSVLGSIGTAILDIPDVLTQILDWVVSLPGALVDAFSMLLTSLFALDMDLVKPKFQSLVLNFKNRFPIFQDIITMFTSTTSAISNPTPPNFSLTLPVLWGGTTHSIFDVTIIDPYMNTFRTITSSFTWLYFSWRFMRRITNVKS